MKKTTIYEQNKTIANSLAFRFILPKFKVVDNE